MKHLHATLARYKRKQRFNTLGLGQLDYQGLNSPQ